MGTLAKGSLFLFLIAALILGALMSVANVQLGLHPIEKHGIDKVDAVHALFKQPGICEKGPSAELQSRTSGRWYYICFLDQGTKVAIWILTKPITDLASREISAIPPEDISRPMRYIANIIARDALVLYGSWGMLPDWFKNLLP